MKDTEKTYKKGLKGIAVFGGLQVYKILLSVLTTKVSAIFLGPAGSGIYGLISSTLMTTEAVVGCGLGTSPVKEISQANARGDADKVASIYCSLNWLIWITGLIGTLCIFVFASQLSELAFGNVEYASWFRILSVTVLMNQMVSGQFAMLTGLQQYKLIARQRIIAGAIGASVSILFYYMLGINGIIPVILLTSLSNLVVSLLVVRKIKLGKCSMKPVEAIRMGGPMLKMGISIGLSYALTHLAGFLIRVYISNLSDVATVGLFTASFSLVNTYLGLVFSSIESDYYPRLSAASDSTDEYRTVMINEMELLLFLLTPLVALLIVFAQPVLAIFYSTKFYAAKTIICWTAMSMLVRVPGWAMSIGIISKGNTVLYFKNQLLFIVYQLGLNIIGFKYGGLTGLGISFAISQFVFLIQNYYIQRRESGFTFNATVVLALAISLGVTMALCLIATYANTLTHYIAGSVLCLISILYCFKELNKRLPIVSYIKSRFTKH